MGRRGGRRGQCGCLGGGQMLESVRSLSNLPLDIKGSQAGSEEEESEEWESDSAPDSP